MAVTSSFSFEEFFPPAILDIQNGTVTMAEAPDALPVPGHVPGTGQPTPFGTRQFNLQRDQPLYFIFRWSQNGLLTRIPPHGGSHIFDFRMEVFFEMAGPGEAPVIPGTSASVDFFHDPVSGPGHNYSQVLQIGGPGIENPLPEGIYSITAKFAWGIKGLPHTPVTGLTRVAMLNMYTF